MQKVIVLPRDDLQTEELVLEEVEVFRVRHFFYNSLMTIFYILGLQNKIIKALSFHIVGSNSNNNNEDFSQTSKCKL